VASKPLYPLREKEKLNRQEEAKEKGTIRSNKPCSTEKEEKEKDGPHRLINTMVYTGG